MKNVILEGLKEGVRFETKRGPLSTEQLFQLPMTELAVVTKAARKLVKATESEDEELSFLSEVSESKVNKLDQLKFEILKEIYTHRKELLDAAKNSKANKEHNEMIDALIAKKQGQKMDELSIEELMALRK